MRKTGVRFSEACRGLGAKPPVYALRGNSLRVHFAALQSALLDQAKVPKDQSDTLDDTLSARIMTLLRAHPSMTQNELAGLLDISVPTVKRAMKVFSGNGRVDCIDEKRYEHW